MEDTRWASASASSGPPGWSQVPSPERKAKPVRPRRTLLHYPDVIRMAVRTLLQQKQLETIATLARSSRAVFAVVIPELYLCVNLSGFRSVHRFLWTHAKLDTPPGPATPLITMDSSTGRRLTRAELYRSSIRHIVIHVGTPPTSWSHLSYESFIPPPRRLFNGPNEDDYSSDEDEAYDPLDSETDHPKQEAWWSSQYGAFPRLQPGHDPLKISTLHITSHRPTSGRRWYRHWIKGALLSFQAKDFRYQYLGSNQWDEPEELGIIARHWDMDHLRSLDVPCFPDGIPISKLRWTRVDLSFFYSKCFDWFLDILCSRLAHRAVKRSRRNVPASPTLPLFITFNPDPEVVRMFEEKLQTCMDDLRELEMVSKVFHFAEDESVGQLTSNEWRRWLRKDYWGGGRQ